MILESKLKCNSKRHKKKVHLAACRGDRYTAQNKFISYNYL